MFRAGDQIGPYNLVRFVGNGAFGTVWLAERRALITTRVALKMPTQGDLDLEAVKQEAQLWVRASGHTNVLHLIEANIYDEQIVLVSEYCPNGSLKDWLKGSQGRAPSIALALEMADGILTGLEHLHSQRVVHHDLKPANILLRGDTPCLADFGLSRVLQSMSQTGKIAGTWAYMAPEALDGKGNEQTDVWSAGVVLYEMVAGYRPFAGNSTGALIKSITDRAPAPLPDYVPAPLRSVILRALHRDRARRYKSAREFREALRRYLHPSTKAAPEPSYSPRRPEPKQDIKPDDQPTIVVPAHPKVVNDSPIKFKGVYQAKSNDGWSYLRFYEDGIVHKITTSGSPGQIAGWFNRQYQGGSRGVFKLDGHDLEFSVNTSAGVVDYTGKIYGSTIEMTAYNRLNGESERSDYVFCEVRLS